MHVTMVAISAPDLPVCQMHSHDEWELVLCLSGQCTLLLGDESIPLTPGVIVCQPPHVPHGFTTASGYQDMCVRISGFVPPAGEGAAVFQDDAAQRFRTLLQLLHESFVQREPHREAIIAALWEALYQLLISWSARSARPTAVTRLIHEMVLHLSDPAWELSEHIARSGYCPDHLRRRFKKETGMTPSAYLTQLRVEHAQRLLALSDRGGYTIKQIGLMSGFHDPYYFSRVFKKVTGVSPNEYQAG